METPGHSSVSVAFLERLGVDPVRVATGGVTNALRALSNSGADEWFATPSNGGRG